MFTIITVLVLVYKSCCNTVFMVTEIKLFAVVDADLSQTVLQLKLILRKLHQDDVLMLCHNISVSPECDSLPQPNPLYPQTSAV